jgi:hypothetical protein
MAAAALGLGCGSLFLRGAAIRRTSLSSSSSFSSRNSIITRSHELRHSSQSVDSRCWKRVAVPAPLAALQRLADETERSNASSEFDAEKPLRGARFLLTATAALTPLLFTAQDALALDGQFGILEGRIFALIHPVMMGTLLLATGWAGYLGWQWRRVRTIQDEINALKKQVPATVEGQAVPSPVQTQINELTETRKALLKGGFRDRHFNVGSILLGAGVLFSFYGGLNTFLRTGKLFPGPHLYAGAAITVLWALAAALVPAMQKGDDTARSLHIALNTVNLLLFIWQVPTGLEIVLKVFEFTKFP